MTESHGSWTNSPPPTPINGSVGPTNCSPIAGATGQTHVLGASDVGHSIEVQETATNGTGTGSPASSTASAGVVVDVPVSTSPPSISGNAAEDSTLTESHGSWTNSPSSYTYQWERCGTTNCLPIAGATGQTHVLGASDVGYSIEVQETAANATGAGSPASSTASAAVVVDVPVSTSPPSISGNAAEDSTLTESHGSWTNSPSSYTYQWEDCGTGGLSPIAGATGQTHVLGASDVGHWIEVQETAANATGAGSPASSTASAVVVSELATQSEPSPPIMSRGVVATTGPTAVVHVTCTGVAGQQCSGAVVVSAWVRKEGGTIVSVDAERGTLPQGDVTVVVARKSFLLAASQREVELPVALDAVGKQLLAGFYTLPR